MMMMTVMDIYSHANDDYRKGMTCHCQAPGKEAIFKVACQKSACFSQHSVCKV